MVVNIYQTGIERKVSMQTENKSASVPNPFSMEAIVRIEYPSAMTSHGDRRYCFVDIPTSFTIGIAPRTRPMGRKNLAYFIKEISLITFAHRIVQMRIVKAKKTAFSVFSVFSNNINLQLKNFPSDMPVISMHNRIIIAWTN
jgi:hypothetical protein